MTLHDATEAMAQSCLVSRSFEVAPFIDLMRAADFDFEALYTGYVGKNVLNFFRQDNGYKEGTYHKLWDKREDNEHLSEVVAELDSRSEQFAEDIYSALTNRYIELTETA